MVQTKKTQSKISPQKALNMLMDGNKRYVENRGNIRDLQDQVKKTSKGQFPFAVILSCIDSRVPVELVFDQGIGDVFSARVAGNVVNEDMLGSLEYACKVAGSKIVLVLGHSSCGAVTSACKDVKLGNITPLLSKIQPAVKHVLKKGVELSPAIIQQVSDVNVSFGISRIRKESKILAEMEKKGEIIIVGAMYDVKNGSVSILK